MVDYNIIFSNLSDEIKNDKELILLLQNHNKEYLLLKYLSKELQDDYDFVFKLVFINGL
jgi:hypothetical protein